MSEWRSMDTAPKDGSTIIIPLTGHVRCFWCKDLERWVLNNPLHIESVYDPKKWRPEGKSK